MLALVRRYGVLSSGFAYNLNMDTDNQTVVFCHGDLVFIFNWHPNRSIPDYILPVLHPGRYRIVLSTDEKRFGGYGRVDLHTPAFTYTQRDGDGQLRHRLKVYNVCRSALVLRRLAR